jgi:hypothetical protein
MQFPFLFLCVYKGEGEKFGVKLEHVLNEGFGCFSYGVSGLFRDLMEVIKLVSDQSNQVFD